MKTKQTKDKKHLKENCVRKPLQKMLNTFKINKKNNKIQQNESIEDVRCCPIKAEQIQYRRKYK